MGVVTDIDATPEGGSGKMTHMSAVPPAGMFSLRTEQKHDPSLWSMLICRVLFSGSRRVILSAV